MDSLDILEIAYVELTGIVLFREEKHVGGGIMAYQVYAVRTDLGIAVIRPGKIRHKRIGMGWLNRLNKRTENLYQSDLPFSRIECIKFLINEIKIEKIYWKHKITEKMMKRIIDAVTKSKEIYDN
jgi:hypothetical protein